LAAKIVTLESMPVWQNASSAGGENA
jgi:hypothetical protein